jgi:transcriptional regulator with XRE-family HTH domain
MLDDEFADDGLPWLGARIRELREERGVSLQDLAVRAHVSRSYLYQLERSKAKDRPVPTAGVLFRIARALGVSAARLVDPDPQPIADLGGDLPAGLVEAADQLGLRLSDVRQLSGIRFRGQQPQSAERWRLLIQQIELSEKLDESPDRNGDARHERRGGR